MSVEKLLDDIFNALSSPVRRCILETLAIEGRLPPSDLMKRCGIRDSKTLRYHVEKLGSLISRDGSGILTLTELGSWVCRWLQRFREDLENVLTVVKSSAPSIAVKPSAKPYALLSLALGLLAPLSTLVSVYASIPLAIASLLMLLLAAIERSRVVLIGRGAVIDVVKCVVEKEVTMRCDVVGLSVAENPFLSSLGLAKASLLLNCGGTLLIKRLGFLPRGYAKELAELLNLLRATQSSGR